MSHPFHIHLIEATTALGAPFPGSEQAPRVLEEAGLLTMLQACGVDVSKKQALSPAKPNLGELPALLENLACACESSSKEGHTALVLGGDHSIAAGTWKGIGRALGQPPGLIWIDAHLDAHTPATSPSGNLHGMPVALLLGEGEARFSGIPGPSLDPNRLVLIGARSAESAEFERLARYGVRIYSAVDVKKRGFSAIFTEARQLLGAGPWGISLDVDALDPEDAPGVSTPEPDGIRVEAMLEPLSGVLHAPGFCALEIVEFNPRQDDDGKTARVILSILEHCAR